MYNTRWNILILRLCAFIQLIVSASITHAIGEWALNLDCFQFFFFSTVEGYCGNISSGYHTVSLYVDYCPNGNIQSGDVYTGNWAENQRLIIEETRLGTSSVAGKHHPGVPILSSCYKGKVYWLPQNLIYSLVPNPLGIYFQQAYGLACFVIRDSSLKKLGFSHFPQGNIPHFITVWPLVTLHSEVNQIRMLVSTASYLVSCEVGSGRMFQWVPALHLM